MTKWFAGLFILAVVIIAGVQATSLSTSTTTEVAFEQLPSAH
jgi:hypothetical protein